MAKPGNISSRSIMRSVEVKSPREILDLTRGITLPNGIVPFNHSTANLAPPDLFSTNSDVLSVLNSEQIGRMQSDMAARFAEAANLQAATKVSAPSPELAAALMSLASFEPAASISSAIFEGALSALKDVWAGGPETDQQVQIGIDPNGNTAKVGPAKTPGAKMDADNNMAELRKWNPFGKYRRIMRKIDELDSYQYHGAHEIFEKWNADPQYLQPEHIARLRELCAKSIFLREMALRYKDYNPHIVEFIRSIDLSAMSTTALESSHSIDLICRYHAMGNPTALPLYIKAVKDMPGVVLMKTGRYLREEGDIYYRIIRDAAAADRKVYDQLTEMVRASLAMDLDERYHKMIVELTLHPSEYHYDYHIDMITRYNNPSGIYGPHIFLVFSVSLIEEMLSTVQRPPEAKRPVVSSAEAERVADAEPARPKKVPPGSYEDMVSARVSDAERIAGEMKPGVPLIVRGTESTGKSTFIRMVQERLAAQKGNIVFFLERGDAIRPTWQKSQPFDGRAEAPRVLDQEGYKGAIKGYVVKRIIAGPERTKYYNAPRAVHNELQARWSEIEAEVEGSGMSPLQYLDSWLAEQGAEAVVVFEEATSPEVLKIILSMLEGTSRIYPIIHNHYASKFEDEFEALFPEGSAQIYFAGFLNLEQTREFVTDFQRRNTHYLNPVSDEVVAHLRYVTGGNMMMLTRYLINALSSNDGPNTLTIEQIDNYLGAGGGPLPLTYWHLLMRLHINQRSILIMIAEGHKLAAKDLDPRMVKGLLDLGLVWEGPGKWLEMSVLLRKAVLDNKNTFF